MSRLLYLPQSGGSLLLLETHFVLTLWTWKMPQLPNTLYLLTPMVSIYSLDLIFKDLAT
jgi:hypothetical protein